MYLYLSISLHKFTYFMLRALSVVNSVFIVIREQWYYNNGQQGVVTSVHFVKIKTKVLQNSLDSNPHQQVHRLLVIRCEQLFD